MLVFQLVDSRLLLLHQQKFQTVLDCLELMMELWLMGLMVVDNPFDLASSLAAQQLDIVQHPIAMDMSYGLMEHCEKTNVMNRLHLVDEVVQSLKIIRYVINHFVCVFVRFVAILNLSNEMLLVVRIQCCLSSMMVN